MAMVRCGLHIVDRRVGPLLAQGLEWVPQPWAVEKTVTAEDATPFERCVIGMESKKKMVAEARLFLRLGILSTVGFIFYYAHLFFGLLDNVVLFKTLAITFLLATVPLPIIAMNSKKLFPELTRSGKNILTLVTAILLFHHFLMTFIFVMFLKGEAVF